MTRIRIIITSCILAVLMVLAGGFWLADTGRASQAALGASILVDTTDDDIDINGNCTLREAIIAANTNLAFDKCPAGSGADTIVLPAGIYTLTIGPPGDNNAQSGDLDVLSAVSIQGAGAGSTVIDGNGLYRIFHILSGSDQVSISGVTIQNGGDAGYAGGITIFQGRLTLSNSHVTKNQGGGLLLLGGELAIDHTKIAENTGGTGGSGIDNWLGVLTVTHSLIEGNSGGGGIANEGTARILNTTITGNSSNLSSNGGGIGNNLWGEMTVSNSTISGNVSSTGGGIINSSDANLTINNSTVTQNTALGGSGGGIFNRGVITLSNTILADNTAYTGYRRDCDSGTTSAIITSKGYNLVGYGCNFPLAQGDRFGVDPLLGPLVDNGGGLPTHALLWHSPAIDSGNPAVPGSGNYSCEATDQRGMSRPQYRACDIGAYESNLPRQYQFFPLTRN